MDLMSDIKIHKTKTRSLKTRYVPSDNYEDNALYMGTHRFLEGAEVELAYWLSKGYTVEEIATKIGITTEQTCDALRNIHTKTGTSNVRLIATIFSKFDWDPFIDNVLLQKEYNFPPDFRFSEREKKCAYMIYIGLTNQEIFKRFEISKRAVSISMEAILSKLKCNSRKEAKTELKKIFSLESPPPHIKSHHKEELRPFNSSEPLLPNPSWINFSELESRCAQCVLQRKRDWEISYELNTTLIVASNLVAKLHRKMGTNTRKQLREKLSAH